MKLPKLVIFDMDGVIIDSERVSKKALRQALKEYQYEDVDHLFQQLMGKSRKNSIAYLNELTNRDSKEMFERQTELFFEMIESNQPQPKKGFQELYTFYRQHHIPMCIASSSRRSTIDRLLKAMHLENAFDQIFSGDQVQNSKPDPEIFNKALAYFQVEGKDALVIEDSKNGILAGVNANIPTIGVVDTVYHPREIMDQTLVMVHDLDCIVALYNQIKLVLFDMDGLLVDTEYLCLEPFRKAHLDYGYEISDDLLHQLIGTSGTILETILRNHYENGYPFEKIIKKADEYMLEEVKKNLPLKPGVRELLNEYRARKIPCIVASSSSRATIEMYLELTNLKEYFQEIACLDDVRQSKPDPAIFLKGCEKMGVDPTCALVYEDSKNGIIAANRANIPVICIPDLVYHEQAIFNQTICFASSLAKLTEF